MKILTTLPAGEAICERCNGYGGIVCRTTLPCSYVGPGPAPDDAQGVCERKCDWCLGAGTVPAEGA